MLTQRVLLLALVPALRLLAQPAPCQFDERCRPILERMEQKAKPIQSLLVDYRRHYTDDVFAETEETRGKIRVLKPDLVRLDVDQPRSAKRSIIADQEWIYEVNYQDKQVAKHSIPEDQREQGGMLANTLPFLAGDKAETIEKKFCLQLLEQTDRTIKIMVRPRPDNREAGFKSTLLILDPETLLPDEVIITEHNNNKDHWRFDQIETNRRVKASDFKPPGGLGWKTIEQPAQ